MPSAARSAGGSLLSSTPGPAIGEPDSATSRRLAVAEHAQAARTLPDGESADDRARRRVDDDHTSAGLVRHVDARAGRCAGAAGCAACGEGDSDGRPPQPRGHGEGRNEDDRQTMIHCR